MRIVRSTTHAAKSFDSDLDSDDYHISPPFVPKFFPEDLGNLCAVLQAIEPNEFLLLTDQDQVQSKRNAETFPHSKSVIVPIDFESSAFPDTSDLALILSRALECLPDEFRGCGCIVLASSSTGLPGTGTRARLFFESVRPLHPKEIKTWLGEFEGVDVSIYSESQPIYVAPPKFENPAQDPFANRSRLLYTSGPKLVPPTIEVIERAAAPVDTDISDAVRVESLRKFNAIIDKLIGSARRDGNFSTYNGLCLALGGLAWALPVDSNPRELFRTAFTEYLGACKAEGSDMTWSNSWPKACRAFEDGEKKPVSAAELIEDFGEAFWQQVSAEEAIERIRAEHGRKQDLVSKARMEIVRKLENPGKFGTPDPAAALEVLLVGGAKTEQALVRIPGSGSIEDVDAIEAKAKKATEPKPKERNGLTLNDKDKPIPSSTNIETIVENDFAEFLRFNVRSAHVEVLSDGEWNALDQDQWLSTLDRHCSKKYGIHTVKSEFALRSLRLVSRKSEADPWFEYLNSLTWDGVPRVETFFIRHLGLEDNTYHRAVGRTWGIGSCVRTATGLLGDAALEHYGPGVNRGVATMVTLVGSQGDEKSKFWASLVPPANFIDLIPDLRMKEALMTLFPAVLVEDQELVYTKSLSDDSLKAFLTTSTDHIRLPYAPEVKPYARRWLLVGTTNNRRYLNDPTGNRRHLPINVPARLGLNVLQALRAERDQLWAEWMDLFRKGVKWWLTPAEEAEAIEARREFCAPDEMQAVADMLSYGLRSASAAAPLPDTQPTWYDRDGLKFARPMHLVMILDSLGMKNGSRYIARAMESLGWSYRFDRNLGPQMRYWQR